MPIMLNMFYPKKFQENIERKKIRLLPKRLKLKAQTGNSLAHQNRVNARHLLWNKCQNTSIYWAYNYGPPKQMVHNIYFLGLHKHFLGFTGITSLVGHNDTYMTSTGMSGKNFFEILWAIQDTVTKISQEFENRSVQTFYIVCQPIRVRTINM